VYNKNLLTEFFRRSIIRRCYISRRENNFEKIPYASHATDANQMKRLRFELACNFADGRTRGAARRSDPTRGSSRAGLIAHANPDRRSGRPSRTDLQLWAPWRIRRRGPNSIVWSRIST